MSSLYVETPADERHFGFTKVGYMKCPHLIKWLTYACKAKENMYFPSSFQLQEYCRRNSHKKCPFYSARSTAEEIETYVSAANF
jgi:hypothetical protein